MDLPLEQEVSSALGDEIVKLQDSGLAAPLGAAVVLDPQNGHVLALSSYPSYDDNWWVTGMTDARYSSLTNTPGYPLNNWAVQSLQPPGSTFKLATATAALNDGVISPSSEIDDTGSFVLPGGQILHDADNAPLGNVNVSEALTASSDFFFYTLGEWFWNGRSKYGETPIQHYANLYGLGTTTGVDLPAATSAPAGSTAPVCARRSTPRRRPSTPTPGTSATTSRWPSARARRSSPRSSWRPPTPPSPTAAPATPPSLAAAIVTPAGKVVRRIAPKVEDHVPMPASTRQALLTGFEGAIQNSSGTAYW